MARGKRSNAAEAFFKSLQAEWKGLYRKLPDQTIFTLADERVVEAIEKRFAQKTGIKNIRQFDYDFYSGLLSLCFEFAPSPRDLGTRADNAFLVILDANCKVIALLDPFDPVQPNVFVPPLPKESEQPFVIDRPSAASHVSYSDAALYPLQVRSRAFFQQLKDKSSLIPIPDELIYATMCTFKSWSPYGPVTDFCPDDCGREPILA